MAKRQETIQLSNLALIILSSISLIFIITANPKPLTISLDKNLSYNVNDRFEFVIPGKPKCRSNKNKGEENKCVFGIEESNIDALINAINNADIQDIESTKLNDQVYITYLQGERVVLKNSNGQIKDTITSTPIKYLRTYFFGILMALVSFSMVFYLLRDTFFNSGRRLENKVNQVKESLDAKLEKIQEMDRCIYVESLYGLTVSDDNILNKYECSNPDEILVISKELESDINNQDLQRQVIKNLKNGISYTWILSEKFKNPPIKKLLTSLYNLDPTVKDNLNCVEFYMLNNSKLMLLPYELNFYIYSNNKNNLKKSKKDISHTPTKLIAFEGNNNINLSSCVPVGEILGTIEGWKSECRQDKWTYFEICSNNRLKVVFSDKEGGGNIPIYTEKKPK